MAVWLARGCATSAFCVLCHLPPIMIEGNKISAQDLPRLLICPLSKGCEGLFLISLQSQRPPTLEKRRLLTPTRSSSTKAIPPPPPPRSLSSSSSSREVKANCRDLHLWKREGLQHQPDSVQPQRSRPPLPPAKCLSKAYSCKISDDQSVL